MKELFSLVVIGLLVYSLMCGYLYVMQRSFIYFPVTESNHKQAGSFFLKNQGETLKIWHLASTGKSAIIYFGGNGEDVAQNVDSYTARFPDHSIYFLNYRGYGGSTGTPTEKGLYADALALFDKAAEKHEKISVIGRSLGSGVATYVASTRKLHRLVLVTPFDSIEALARRTYPVFPVSLLLKDRYDSVGRATEIATETLILLAEHDEIIPYSHSQNLVMNLDKMLTKTIIIPDTTHNTIDNSLHYQTQIAEFLNQ